MGYYRAGFTEIVGVDIVFQPRYPFNFIQEDALEYLRNHGHEFDFIHASPPCQRYSHCTPVAYRSFHPDLILPLQVLLGEMEAPYAIENVPNARHLLRDPIMLCGSMFDLPIFRHRYFEVNPAVFTVDLPFCNHNFVPVLITGRTNRKGQARFDYSVAERRTAIGCEWMIGKEVDQAIPPAYTKWLGEQFFTFGGLEC